MRSQSYLNTAQRIIQTYDASIPLASWLKQFFRTDKKFGSRDRKEIAHACYCFYRLGYAFGERSIEDRILVGLFVCSEQTNTILEEQRPDWARAVGLPLKQKLSMVLPDDEVNRIFPFNDALSHEIELRPFCLSFLIQPDLYLRTRPGKKEKLLRQLEGASVPFVLRNDACIALPNQTKVDAIIHLDEDAVVQDYNSQRIVEVFDQVQLPVTSQVSVWDCCAASGGKSISFHDRFPNSHLTVSDVRETILINLHKRFKKAGITSYDHFVADVSSPSFSIQKKFDVVICDVPCSGSGTWSRTPEQLQFFRNERIGSYAELQKRMVTNAAKAVKKNGYLLYITCSVFEMENEGVVQYIRQSLPVQLISMQYFRGYDKKADTLFAALFAAS